MSYSNPILTTGGTSAQSVYTVATTARHPVGTRAVLSDGRSFEYVRLKHATPLVKGGLVTYDPVAAAIDSLDVAAGSSIGATTVSVTVASASDNLYEGSYLSVEEGPGEGELYRIVSHPLHATTTVFTLDRPLVVAVTTATNVTIVQDAGAVKISVGVAAAALPVEVAAGVPLVSVGAGNTTNQFFWVQKTGLATVLFGTAVGAVGQPCYHGENGGDFQVSVQTTAQAGRVHLGTIAALLPVDTEYAVVRLNIA